MGTKNIATPEFKFPVSISSAFVFVLFGGMTLNLQKSIFIKHF